MTKLFETIEIETGKNPTVAVIWMHGLGAQMGSTLCRRAIRP